MEAQWISHRMWEQFNKKDVSQWIKLFSLAALSMMTLGCVPDVKLNKAEVKPSDNAGSVTLTPELAEDLVEASENLGGLPEGISFTWPDLPPFKFNSSGPGDIVYGGGCQSDVTRVEEGLNNITFSGSEPGVYDNCTITVHGDNGAVSEPLDVPAFVIVRERMINDTGVRHCGDYAYITRGGHDNDIDCLASGASRATAGVDGQGDPVPAGQDAVYGRDADPALNGDNDGHGGFSFTKLDSNGMALAAQNVRWQDDGSSESGSHWDCVADNVTGLVWEVKKRDGSLHDQQWTYSWYNDNNAINGGHAGLAGGDNSVDTCSASGECDTQQYLKAVNDAGLCGHDDWRLPTSEELLSIVSKDRVSPALDRGYFPNTESTYYWTINSYSGDTANAWLVNFYLGYEYILGKSQSAHVRLVRSSH